MASADKTPPEKFSLKKELIGLKNSFKYAGEGLKHVLVNERNFRIHTLAAVIVIGLNFYFQIEFYEWIAIIFCIAFVMTSELFNTAIEVTIDLVTKGEYHPLAKIAKDVAASAVIVAAIVSVAVGLIIYIPYIFKGLF
ncbi:diacylglycerol kinase family protein [Fundicoccus culcitae]|uniref:Diacylglycerol kinase family protein n=1 Tax=Fundicoccus culcitae TaxID=2969821 RepID=A0ABY5P6I5_9LACT|nr:diacylglycerol kinase family protein [Fundicoccus culcitae]UUX34357.1 diacylglycerol kinase family protein [Fundicoccus culcitae]